ncbi:methenyltetrahydrofolate synthase domain-containing protein isoform X2 [Phlebotomus argentipes]|uniref:methenyltetrahydrofolate synthase domain-containing protein isoform X2 n=1 Tax=Phlebotomus argentipes TaxID=94469 RepID=UPI00289356B4|nr:methenyltetrahydrofolate synthase domain-containing protein isoform X2 [Phlebotomus argentipes]
MEPSKENGDVPKSEEITKRSIRVQVWKKLLEQKAATHTNYVYNRITNFVGAEKAAALLADTQEFKNAQRIKINTDKPQEPIKLLALGAGKPLFVSPVRDSTALLAKLEAPADADLAVQKQLIRPQVLREKGEEINHDTDLKLDMIVIGSVAVDREGRRIGKGNGYVDLDFALLVHCGVITNDTLIVTTVHDAQVSDSLPADLFKSYDVPVDMIVTPTEVIRVAKRLPRPQGIEWPLLSQRRLGIVPVLKVLKEKEEAANKAIELKAEDTDVESNRKPRQNRNKRFMKRQRKPRAENNGENNENQRTRRPRRKFPRRRSERDNQNGQENPSEKPPGDRRRGTDHSNNICIKVTNISKNVRVKDIKAEIRQRGCNPHFISWKSGRCFLYFHKPATDLEQATNDLLNSLADLKVRVQNEDQMEEVELRVEIMKSQERNNKNDLNRIETTDVTAV